MAKFSFRETANEVWENVTTLKRAVFVLLSSVLLLFGVVGTFIPLVPARLIASPAVLILSVFSPTLYRTVIRWTQKYPRVQSRFDRIRNWVIHRIH